MEQQKADVLAELDKLREAYKSSGAVKRFTCLVYGDMGTGKTRLLKTCRRPVLVHSFDPGGTKTIRKEIEEGWLVADTRFEREDSRNPTVFLAWQTEFRRLADLGVFNEIGTFALDSLTLWADALMNQLLKLQGRPGGVPQLQDWQVQMNNIRDEVKRIVSLPCDCIVTAHVDLDKDELSGRIEAGPMVTGKLRAKLPAYFDEVYVAQAKETSKGVEYSLLTQNSGYYKARTRLGAEGVFALYEKPDVLHLLEKAGLLEKGEGG